MNRCSECGAFRESRTRSEVDRLVAEFLALKGASPGITLKDAAIRLGVHNNTLSHHLRKRGISSRLDYDAIAERYWMLRGSGYHELTMAQIAEKIGVTERAVYRALKQNNYEDEYDYA